MKQKTIGILAAFAVLCAVLGSCYWQAESGTGSISFTFSGGAGSRFIEPYSTAIRVYLKIGPEWVPFGPAAHPYWDEVTIAQNTPTYTYTSPKVPAPFSYTVIVAAGESMDGLFYPLTHGRTATPVQVTQGGTTNVTLTMDFMPSMASAATRLNLWGQNVTGVIYSENTFSIDGFPYYSFASTEHALYYSAEPGTDNFILTADVPSAVINSLSTGEISVGSEQDDYAPYLNTSTGLLPYQIFDTAPYLGPLRPDVAAGAVQRNVIRSLSAINQISTSYKYIMYLYDRGIGCAPTQYAVTNTWYDVDFSAYRGGTRMYDMAASNATMSPVPAYVYMATSVGAYRVPCEAFTDGVTADSLIAASLPFEVPGRKITSLAVVFSIYDYTKYLYMGTDNGLYWAPLDEMTSVALAGSPALVPGTEGRAIRKMDGLHHQNNYFSTGGYDRNLIACVDENGIFIADHDLEMATTEVLGELPIYTANMPADIPAEINQVDIYVSLSENAVFLLTAGRKGLARSYIIPYGLP